MDDISLLLEKKLSKKETKEKEKVVKGLSRRNQGQTLRNVMVRMPNL